MLQRSASLTVLLACMFTQSVGAARQGSTDVAAAGFTEASLNGLYAYANITDDTRAGYGTLEFDGQGHVSTDGITLNVPGSEGRQLFDLGFGSGTYTLDASGRGTVSLDFEYPDPAGRDHYDYEFIIMGAQPDPARRVLQVTRAFAASATTGVANASVTLAVPPAPGHAQAAMSFDLASLEGAYAYANNADVAASYGVLEFDGSGNVTTSQIAVNVPDPDNPGQRLIKQTGEGAGTYNIDSSGRGAFTLYFPALARPYTYEFVVTGAARDPSRGALLITDAFSVITITGLANQLVAPVLTRILAP